MKRYSLYILICSSLLYTSIKPMQSTQKVNPAIEIITCNTYEKSIVRYLELASDPTHSRALNLPLIKTNIINALSEKFKKNAQEIGEDLKIEQIINKAKL